MHALCKHNKARPRSQELAGVAATRPRNCTSASATGAVDATSENASAQKEAACPPHRTSQAGASRPEAQSATAGAPATRTHFGRNRRRNRSRDTLWAQPQVQPLGGHMVAATGGATARGARRRRGTAAWKEEGEREEKEEEEEEEGEGVDEQGGGGGEGGVGGKKGEGGGGGGGNGPQDSARLPNKHYRHSKRSWGCGRMFFIESR